MKYFFKRYRQNGGYTVSFTDYMPPSWRVYGLTEHKAIAFLDRWTEAVKLARSCRDNISHYKRKGG